MKDIRQINVSTSTFFITLTAVVSIIVFIFISKFMNIKENEIGQKSENIDTTVGDLHSQITNMENNTFTLKQVKASLKDYFNLYAAGQNATLIQELGERGKLKYNTSKWDTKGKNKDEWATDIKFSEYKNAMLNYISENEFDRHWNPNNKSVKVDVKVNKNGYIIPPQPKGNAPVYSIDELSKHGDYEYKARVQYIINEDISTIKNYNYNFIVANSNGKCIIDSINVERKN